MANPTVLVGPPRGGDRAHRIQGHLARDLAGRAGRRGYRHRPAARRPSRRCSRPAACRAASTAGSPTCARASCSRATCARRSPRSCSIWPRSRWSSASLQDPVATFQTNILGAVNLLDAARRLPSLRAIVVITSDKCYLRPDRRCAEGDAAGRPRSLQRQQGLRRDRHRGLSLLLLPAGCVASASPRRAPATSSAAATSRPGRLLPDLIRAFAAGKPAELRHPAGRAALAARARRAGRLPAAGRAAGREPGLVLDRLELRPRRRTRAGPRPRIAEAAAERFGGGSWRAGRQRPRDRGADCCCCPPSRPSAGSAGDRG